MTEHHSPEGLRADVAKALTENPAVMLDALALQFGVDEKTLVSCLPKIMCSLAPGHDFKSIWDEMSRWEKVTFIVTAPGVITEVKGPLPAGTTGHGFFNIGTKGDALGGHISADQVEIIAFVSKAFMGLESHSIRFYHQTGSIMFSVYVGRNGRELIPDARDRFLNLQQQYQNKEES